MSVANSRMSSAGEGRLRAAVTAHPYLLAAVGLYALAAVSRLSWWRTALWEDPGAYLYVGRRLLEGATPYVDVAEPKPPLTHLLYGVIDLVTFRSVVAVQIIAVGFLVVAALALARYVEHHADRRTGFLAAALLVVLSTTPLLDGKDVNTEHLALAPLLVALLLGTRGTVIAAAGAGALTAFAIGMNLGFAPFALLLALELWRSGRDRGGRVRLFAAAAVGGVAVIAPVVIWLFAVDAWETAKIVVWEYSNRAADGEFSQYVAREASLRDFLDLPGGPLWLLGLAAGAVGCTDRRLRPLAISAIAWIVVMWVRLKLNRGPEYPHHGYLALPGIAVGLAVGLAAVTSGLPVRRVLAVGALVLALPVWTYAVSPEWKALGESVAERGDRFALAYPIRDFIDRTTPDGAPIFVAGSEAEIYWLADRRSPTRFFANYLLFTHPFYWEERARTLERNPPAAIAAIDPEGLFDPGGGDINAVVETLDYELKFDVGGAKVWLHPRYARGVPRVRDPDPEPPA